MSLSHTGTMKPTIVTAYYRVKSKHSNAEYDEWIKTFAGTLENPVVFFGEAEWCKKFKAMRGDKPTRCVTLPFSELPCAGLTDWNEVWQNDKFKHLHTPDLYVVWNSKPSLVKNAISLNPFSSEIFAWVDVGCFRIKNEASLFRQWPTDAKLATVRHNRITLLQVEPFLANDSILDKNGLPADFHGANRIGGGIMVGNQSAWLAWEEAYYDMLNKFVAAGRYCGSEQNVVSALALTRPDLVQLVVPDNIGNKWLYLQRHFV